MRQMWLGAVLIAACDGASAAVDAPPDDNTPADTPADEPTCQSRTLLVGGTDVVAQGWTTVTQAPFNLSNGPDVTHLQTMTPGAATTGGLLLLRYPDALDVGLPFALEVVMQVEQVDPHNPLDSAAALLGSFTAPFGSPAERAQMLFLDSDKIGWADDTQQFAVAVTDGAFHTFVLSVDGPDGNATVSIDGVLALTRGSFVYNGTIALGDQTNEPNIDSSIGIKSVRLLCHP